VPEAVTRTKTGIKRLIGSAWLRLNGWRLAGEVPEPRKFVLILAPHTSNWDVPFMLALAWVYGIPIEWMVKASPFTPPRGVPEPCNYSMTRPGAPGPKGDAGAVLVESWTFDLDCRPDYEERAELLFAEYAKKSEELVAEYSKRTTGPGVKPPTDDAGVPLRAPQAAHEAVVGRKALDHHGQGLLFVDDDAPCYVRVVGPDAERRLGLAQLVAGNLTEANAPMKPHGDPVMKK